MRRVAQTGIICIHSYTRILECLWKIIGAEKRGEEDKAILLVLSSKYLFRTNNVLNQCNCHIKGSMQWRLHAVHFHPYKIFHLKTHKLACFKTNFSHQILNKKFCNCIPSKHSNASDGMVCKKLTMP